MKRLIKGRGSSPTFCVSSFQYYQVSTDNTGRSGVWEEDWQQQEGKRKWVITVWGGSEEGKGNTREENDDSRETEASDRMAVKEEMEPIKGETS